MKKLAISTFGFCSLALLLLYILPAAQASRWLPAMAASVPFTGQLTTQHDTWNRMTTINVFSNQQVFFEVTHIRVSTNGSYTINVAANGFTPAINVYGGTFFPATPQVNFWDNGVIGNSLTVFLAGGQEFDIVISTAAAGQTGTYSASIDGSPGITVTPPPPLGILSSPLDATIRPGQNTTLEVSTQGRPPKTFQWFQGNTGDTSTPISGATASTFTTPALFADTSYWVRISDGRVSVNSGTATVFVTNGPISYSSALTACDDRFNRLVPRANPGDPIRQSGQIVSYKLFRFRVSTPGSYSFQLNTSGFNGVMFLYQGVFLPSNPGVNFFGNSQTGTSVNLTTNLLADGNVMHLVIAQLAPNDTGTFTVTASGPAFVTKLPAPVLTTPLANANITRGQPASFNVNTSSTNLSVQWFKGCTNRTLIPNETKLNYTTPPQTRDDVYTVRLENPGGYETSSANVTILPSAGDVNADAIVQNTSLSVVAPGLLRSVTAADGRALAVQKVSDPAHGTVSINSFGGFTYTPAVNFFGADSFTYRASDGVRFSNTATVFLNVVPIFANNTPTNIPASGQASNYPSTINVSGLAGTITKVRVKLDRLHHENQGDLDILLQGPQGQALVLMSDANGDPDNPFLFDRVLNFEDAATNTIFDGQALFDGTYRPVNYGGGDSFPPPAPTIFNSPAPAGTATFASTFNGTDPNGAWKLFIFDDQGFNSGSLPGWSLTIFTAGGSCPHFTITPATLPESALNQPFPETTLAASGGSGVYSFQVTAGNLPNGMNLSTSGVLSGTPTQAGFFTFTVTAKDENNCIWQRVYTLNVVCPLITISPVTLPIGAINQPYNATLTGSGGSGPYIFSKVAGALPAGVTLNANGMLGGTPTQPGVFDLTVQAQDAKGCTGAQDFTLTINCQSISVIAPANNTALVNAPFSAQFTQTGGAGTTLFATTSALPDGVKLLGSGTLSGTATRTGSFPLVITATDSNGCAGTINFTLTVGACPAIALADLPGGVAGATYQQTLSASPTDNYSFALTSGTLPAGLTLANGALSGTPTQTGVFNFRLTATGSGACSGFRDYQLNIVCPVITLTPTPLATGTLGGNYSQTLTALPAGNYSFVVTGGALPPGLSLNAAGVINGTPLQTGLFNFRVTATGVSGCAGFADYQLNVNGCPTIALAPATLPSALVDTPYNQTLGATPAGGYAFSIASGALPPGLSLNSATGLLGGTPSTPGRFSFQVAALLGGCAGLRDYTLTVTCPAITLSASLPGASAGAGYNQTIGVTPAGGYAFSIVAGSLPFGLSLNAATGTLSGMVMSPGTFDFTIKAQAANGCAGIQAYTLPINCPQVALSALTAPSLGAPYNQILSVTPAGGNYVFAISAGALPSGLTLNASTGVISGLPSSAGTFTFTIVATGFGTCGGSRTYTLAVGDGVCPAITLSDLPDGAPGQLYSASVVASPVGSYGYEVTSGSLPPGLTLFGGFGLIFGFPTAAGTFKFTITASSQAAANCTGSRSYSILIGAPPLQARVFGDFDGDGKADLSVWRGIAGDWLTLRSSDGKPQSELWGSSAAPYFDVMAPGDYDGDGKTDIAIFRRATGEWWIKHSKDGAVVAKKWGIASDVPVAGDYDGDGKTDIAVWRGAETNWYILRSSDGQTQIVSWGTSNAPYRDLPVPADYDGDGKTDIAVFRQASGKEPAHWHIRLSSDGSSVDKVWGQGTDIPVPVDYDGDGKADLAVWRGAETNWLILNSSDQATQTVSWGSSSLGDLPVPGDYDGDGKADIAIWRESEGRWYVRQSHDNNSRRISHGQRGDVPVTAKL